MRFSLKIILLLLLAVFVCGGLLLSVWAKQIAGSEEFRRFAEQKVGEFLKAKVHIGEIKPYHFNQIALDKIIIETSSGGKQSQLIRVDRLLFRYRLSQLWTRRFELPAGIVIRNPSVLIDQNQFPYRYFETDKEGGGGVSLPALEFKGGEIRYLLPSIGKEILLTEVDGKISPSTDRRVQVDVRAKASGFLNGRVSIYGTIQPFQNTHDLWLDFGAVKFSRDIPIPFKDLRGKVHWVGPDLFFDDLRTVIYGWNSSLSGAFTNREDQPEVSCHIQVGRERALFKLDFLLNLPQHKLKGTFKAGEGKPVDFDGKVRQEGNRFIMDSFQADPDYRGRGELDFATGNYELFFEGAKTRRLGIHSNLRGLEFVVRFQFDHFRLANLDIVTRGKLFLHPVTMHWGDRNFLFKGAFETDYFILEKQPLDDFQGLFEVSPYGINGIQAGWGGKFKLTGQVPFSGKNRESKFMVRVDDFDLGLVKEFIARPLRKELGGSLDGKVTIQGELMNPQISGTFNIQDGRWGQLNYDHGIIQLRGTPPYFVLQDSKIWKGRTTFYLNGAVDLRLDNIFAGVKIESPDNIVIWKGLEAVVHSKDGSVEVNDSRLGNSDRFSSLEASAKTETSSKDLGSGEEEKTTLKFGPKLKF